MNPLVNQNPLIAKLKLPGKVFQLPSKGLLYPPGVLKDTVINGEIEVKAMSALTELKMRTADMLISGKILQEVCDECVPDVLKAGQLVSKDVDAIFCFLVIATYGAMKEVRAIHDCENADLHSYKINLDNIVMHPNNSALNHKEMLFMCELPNGQTVRLKPVTFEASLVVMNMRQEISRIEMAREQVPRELLEQTVLTDILSVIEAVEDVSPVTGEKIRVTDRKHIEEWVKALTKPMTDAISAAATRAHEWGFQFTQQLTCQDCGQEFTHDLELNPVSFFSG